MKKIISLLLAVAISAGCIPVFAVENKEKSVVDTEFQWEVEDIGTSIMNTPIPINEVQVDETELETEEVVVYEPIVNTEIINEKLVFPDENINLIPVELPEAGEISLFSLSSDDSVLWKTLYAEQFGDDYLNPYKKKEDGQRISGNTNRLVIEETDLTLPGKNGLDVVIKRQHDNQNYNNSYSYYREYDDEGHSIYFDSTQWRYIYGFTNEDTDETLYVGFLTEDQMYTYMYDGVYIEELDEDKRTSCTKDGETIRYYDFEYVESRIDTEDALDYYEYDDSIGCINDVVTYKEATPFMLESRKVFNNRDYIGGDWKLLLPEAYLYSYSRETSENSVSETYKREYVGAFRDMNGNVHTFTGDDEFIERTVENPPTTSYESSFTPDENKYLSFESIYKATKPAYENGPVYNFVVYDSRGLTYYFHNTGVQPQEKPTATHEMYILAVKDKYDNMIKYEYGDNYGSITKIIDTYGREINISSIENGKQISYYDDVAKKQRQLHIQAKNFRHQRLKTIVRFNLKRYKDLL